MQPIVMKFGGTSVADAQAYARVARLIESSINERPVVVVSAMSGMTDALLKSVEIAALDGEWARARELRYRLLPLMEGNFVESSPGPVKAAMALMGLIEENLRLPLVPVEEKTRALMRKLITELGLLKETSHVAA